MNAVLNGVLVTPDAVLRDKVLLFDEKIVRIEDKDVGLPAGCRTFDAAGGYVLPGFVDIHVHGGGGADFLDADPDAVATVLRTHARHGTTSLLATTLTCPDGILYAGIERLGAAIEDGTPEDGAEILGVHLEGPYFSAAAKGAQAIREEKIPSEKELNRLYALSRGHIVRFDAAPELPNMELFAAWTKERGILASVGHSGANAETVLAFCDKGFSHITHLYCSTTTEHKEGQTVHGGIVEAAYLDDRISVELIADGKHVPRETMLLVFKIKGAKKTSLVTDAMRAAGTDVKTSVLGEKNTGTPVIIEDGVAKLPDRSSFAGSIATMDVCFRTALRYGVPLCDAAASCTLTPAAAAGVAHRKGSLDAGKDADVLILDGELRPKTVFLKGKPIGG